MKIYDLKLSEGKQGVTAIALVDLPAIESDFMAFANEKPLVFSNEEKQVVLGPVLIPDRQIFRDGKKYGMEDFYVKFSAETIEALALKFHRDQLTKSVNEDHNQMKYRTDVFMFESCLIRNEAQAEAYVELGLEKLPVGSWIAAYKIEDKELFNRVKAGEFNGFSVEVSLDLEEVFKAAFEDEKPDEEKKDKENIDEQEKPEETIDKPEDEGAEGEQSRETTDEPEADQDNIEADQEQPEAETEETQDEPETTVDNQEEEKLEDEADKSDNYEESLAYMEKIIAGF